MPERRQSSGSNAALAIFMLLASAALHLLLRPLGDRILASTWGATPLPPTGSGLMEVSLVEPPEPEDEEEDAAEPKQDRLLPGELIQQDDVRDEERPEETDRISEFDRAVQHETHAPRVRPTEGARSSTPSPPQVAPSAERGDGGDAGAEAPSGESIPEDGLGKLSLRPGEERDDGADRAPGPPSGRPGLRGTPEQMREIFGSRSSHDAVEDVDEGADNILNSKRWKYASFFNRVRDAIAQHWDPVSVRAARDPDGTRWGTQTRTTSLFLRLNADGSVKRISIERSCGIAALDEEAIRAVRAAQPFPNPPRQLVDPSTGTIDFPFGFILEINGSPRIIRMQR